MKILKSKTLHLKKTTLKISDLLYNKHYEKYNVILDQGVEEIKDIMIDPIEVIKHSLSNSKRYGADGKPYLEKLYSVHKGSQRVTQAKKLGYTHIEGIILNV